MVGANGDISGSPDNVTQTDDRAKEREANAEQSESGKSPLSVVRDVSFIALVVAYLSGFTYYYSLMTDLGLPITLTDVPIYQFVVYAYEVYSSMKTILVVVPVAALVIGFSFLMEWFDKRYFSGPIIALLELAGDLFERVGTTEGLVESDRKLIAQKISELPRLRLSEDEIRQAVEKTVPLGPLKLSADEFRFLRLAIPSLTRVLKTLRYFMFTIVAVPALFRLINKRTYKPILAVTAALTIGVLFFVAADAAHVQYDALRSTGTSNKDIFGTTQFSAEHRIRFAFRKDEEEVYPHDFRLANNALSLQILNESKDQYQVLILHPLKPGQPTLAHLYARVFCIRKEDVLYYTSVTI